MNSPADRAEAVDLVSPIAEIAAGGNEMRIIVARIICLASVSAFVANAQEGPPLIKQRPTLQYSEEREVRRIRIIAKGLPPGLSKKIGHAIRGKLCFPDEIQERVRQGFRDLGYEEARVDKPKFAPLNEPWAFSVCDVSVHALPGARYLLGAIQFKGNSAISAEELRGKFAIEKGGLFNASAVGEGLDSIRRLYLSKGYINMGAIPKIETDELRDTIILTVDIDEGKAWDFGRLLLEGPEPYAGAGKALIAAWTLDGKRFNPELLTEWISANAPFLPKGDDVLLRNARTRFNWVTQRVDIQLEFPWSDPPTK